MKKGSILLVLSIMWLGVAAQQPEVEDSSTKKLLEVVVTAQRQKQPKLLVPFSVSSIDKNQMAQYQYRTTPEAMMAMNGVFVQKTNHGGGSPFLRGVTGNQTLILVDGIRLNNATFRYGPNQYLNTVDAYSIEKIEVAKGTGSVQYGTDAIGGVINLITVDPTFSIDSPRFGGKALVKYMTGYMERTLRGEATYSNKKVAVRAGISSRNFGDIIGGDTTGKQSPSGYEEWAVDLKAKFLLNQNIQLTIANQLLQQQHVPVYHKVRLENFSLNEMDPQQRWLSYARLQLQHRNKWIKETQVTLAFQEGIEGRTSVKNGSSIVQKEKDRTQTVSVTANVFSAIHKNWSANSGMEIYADRVKSSRSEYNVPSNNPIYKRGLYPNNATAHNYSGYSLHHLQLGKWIIDAGMRINVFNIGIPDTTLGNVQISPAALVSNVAAMYQLSQQQKLYVSYSSGYRAPNIDDLGTLGIVDFRYEVPTANLAPEKSQHTEVGYKYQSKFISATFAAYYMHLSNLITRVKTAEAPINGYAVYKKENTESAFIKGVEAEIMTQLHPHVSMNAGVSYSYGQSLSKNEPLRRIPPFNGRVVSSYKNSRWFASAEWQFAAKQIRLAQGDKDDNRIGKEGTAGWQLVNLYTGYHFRSIQLNMGLQNLFNQDYKTHGSGINGVGRSAWISFSIKI